MALCGLSVRGFLFCPSWTQVRVGLGCRRVSGCGVRLSLGVRSDGIAMGLARRRLMTAGQHPS